MPTFVKTAMNPNGTWQQDGMDQIQAGNRDFMANQGAQALQAQLAMAQLKSGDARYGAGLQAQGNALTAQVGLGHDQLGMQRDMYGQQYKFMNDEATRQHADSDRQWAYNTDPTKNPFLQAQIGSLGSESALAKFRLDHEMALEKQRSEAANVPGVSPTDLASDPADIQANYRSDLATSTPVQAAANRTAAVAKRSQGNAQALADAFGSNLDRFNQLDTDYVGRNPSDTERKDLENQYRNLISNFQKGGDAPDIATMKAKSVLLAHAKHQFNSGNTDKLLEELGIQDPDVTGKNIKGALQDPLSVPTMGVAPIVKSFLGSYQ